MILDSELKKIQLVLGGTPAAVYSYVASYIRDSQRFGEEVVLLSSEGTIANTTPVDVVPAPAAGYTHQLKDLFVRSADGSVSLTVRYNNNGSLRSVWAGSLGTNNTLQYTDTDGFEVIDATGALLSSGGGSSSSLTVEEVDGSPSVSTVSKIKFAQGDGFTVTDETGGVVRINISAAPAPDNDARILAWILGES